MTKELITVKEYCKRKKISDTAARKQINTNKVDSVMLKDITYIVIESDIKVKQKNSIKLKNKEIQILKNKLNFFEDQKDRIIKLEDKIEKLEDKLERQRDTKEELYEKVIGHMTDNRLTYKG